MEVGGGGEIIEGREVVAALVGELEGNTVTAWVGEGR